MRKTLGIIMLAVGISGIVLSIAGLIAGRRLVDSMGSGLRANLTLTEESLTTVKETLILTRITIGQLNDALSTVEETADNAALALDNTRPLLEEASVVTTEDVPESIEAFQETLPALTNVAGAIDDTLRTLSTFNMRRSIFGIPLSFDLGVEYDPEVPFDESVKQIGTSLDGLPEKLRSLKENIEVTNNNLQTISRNMNDIADNLLVINDSLSQVEPLLDNYIDTVTELSNSTRESRLMLEQQTAQLKLVVTIVMLWLGLTQIAPIYLGWELISGQRNDKLTEE